MFGRVNNKEGAESMQKNIEKLLQLSLEWQIIFNVRNMQCIGKQQMVTDYIMDDSD